MTAGGQANGNADAPAEIIPAFMAIFNIITSTAAALPPSATVAKVKPIITASIPKKTTTIIITDSSYLSLHPIHTREAASL